MYACVPPAYGTKHSDLHHGGYLKGQERSVKKEAWFALAVKKRPRYTIPRKMEVLPIQKGCSQKLLKDISSTTRKLGSQGQGYVCRQHSVNEDGPHQGVAILSGLGTQAKPYHTSTPVYIHTAQLVSRGRGDRSRMYNIPYPRAPITLSPLHMLRL